MVGYSTKNRIAFISSYPPRKCGIATFTSDLIENMFSASNLSFEPVVIAMQSNTALKYPEPVEFVIRRDLKSDYMEAADFIKSSHIDIVMLQHEFGLFGGEGGSYIVSLLKRLNVPVITTLHTVLERPSQEYFQSLIDVCDWSEKVTVMNNRGIIMLKDLYRVSQSKINLIPHGVPDIPFGKTEEYKRKLNLTGRKVILTFGLLGPNKGIEVALNALPAIIKENPDILYLIVGTVHPEIVKSDGYCYRDKLQQIVERLGIHSHVLFHDRFVTDEQLKELLAAADIYVTPYLNKEQLTSGTLSFAVGSGKAVVSTPYWAAEELLDDGRGMLVPFGDSQKLSEAITTLFNNTSLLSKIQKRTYDYGRKMIWANVGNEYHHLVMKQLHQTIKRPHFDPIVRQQPSVASANMIEQALYQYA